MFGLAALLLTISVLVAASVVLRRPEIAVWLGILTERDGAALALGGSLYASYCGRCHGAELEGQPHWKTRFPTGRLPAPPHDASGHTWHHSDAALIEITKRGTAAVVGGGYESDMPGFQGVLADEEIAAVLDFIKSTWPERERRYQNQVTQRQVPR